MIDILEIIKSGRNGFTWCDEDYRILCSKDGIVYGEGNPDRSKKKAVPIIALDESDFIVVGLNKEERAANNQFHKMFD